MSDTPKAIDDPLSNVELATLFAEVAKRNGQADVFVIVLGPTKSNGTFERCAYVDGDAGKVVQTLAAFIREKVPSPLQQQLIDLISQPQPAEPANPQWVN